MKDETIIFKHSGAGTGFYGGSDWTGDYFQSQITELLNNIFNEIDKQSKEVY